MNFRVTCIFLRVRDPHGGGRYVVVVALSPANLKSLLFRGDTLAPGLKVGQIVVRLEMLEVYHVLPSLTKHREYLVDELS